MRSDHGQVPGTRSAHLALHCLTGTDGCTEGHCYCRCHAILDEVTWTRIRLAAGEASRVTLDHALAGSVCCDSHNIRCEPPGDLCCPDCTEAAHDTFPIRHADGSRCILEAP